MPANGKHFQALKAQFARQGGCLYRTGPVEGRVPYFIERNGLIRLADLANAITSVTMMEVR